MGDQKQIPCVVITYFFHSLLKAILKTAELPSLVWCRFFYFSTICSSCRHVRIRVYTNIQTARPVVRIILKSLDFWSSKTITSILFLSVVLLKPCCHDYNPHYDIPFRCASICVPPNNPITACGATSFPGYHSFPKWAMHCIDLKVGAMEIDPRSSSMLFSNTVALSWAPPPWILNSAPYWLKITSICLGISHIHLYTYL